VRTFATDFCNFACFEISLYYYHYYNYNCYYYYYATTTHRGKAKASKWGAEVESMDGR